MTDPAWFEALKKDLRRRTYLTLSDQERLAHIRLESEKWVSLNPDARQWNDAFLLRIIDKLIARINNK